MEKEGSGVPAISNGEHGLPALREARGVHGSMNSRDLCVGYSTSRKPTEHFDRVLSPEASAEGCNRVGDCTLIEQVQRDLDVRRYENVWLEGDRAVQSLAKEQSDDGPILIAVGKGLDLTQGRLSHEDLAQSTTGRLKRCDDVVRVAERLPLDRHRDRHRLSPNALRLS
jgi:hypothetical protein